MKTKNRFRRLTLTVVAGAAIAFFAVVLPVLGAPDPDADRLHMTSGDDAFRYGDEGDEIVQPIVQGNSGCEIKPATGPLATLSSSALSGGGVKGPGIFDHGIGVKSGGSNGTPCSETSDKEQLTISSNGNSWFELRLNVEAKGNAWIVVELALADGPAIQTHQLLTGASIETYNVQNGTTLTPTMDFPYTATTVGGSTPDAACANPSDSGADSGPNDNCLWTIQANAVFDTVRIHTLVGAVSLEGGHDFEAFDAAGTAAGQYDSLFFRYHAPVAENDSYSTDEDNTLTVNAAEGVLANDSDDIGSSLTAVLVSGPSNGTVTLNGDGSFEYVPFADANGTDSFTYQATAGADPSDPAIVTITVNPVNDAPVAANIDDGYTTDEDVTLTVGAPGVLGNDSDVDGDPLTAVLDTGPSSGVLALNADGSFTYTPSANFNGSDSFTYRANDGTTDSNIATVTITVNSVNDEPVALGVPLEATEDTQTTFSGSDLAEDADGDPLTITAAEAEHGMVSVAGGILTYDPPADSCEDDALISYTVVDGNGGTLTGSIVIEIDCVNDAPVAVDDTYETDERYDSGAGILTLTLNVPASGVLGNDTDVDGDPLGASGATGSDGSVTLNPDGSFAYTPGAHDWLAGGEHFSYVDTWDYTVSDDPSGATDTGAVSITVHRVICSAETVTDVDGDYSGSFTLLTPNIGCKRYEVDADATTQSVTFTPDPREGQPEAFFRGELTFAPQVLSQDGTFSLGLVYDPDNDGPLASKTLQVCENPVFEAGKIVSATIPTGETWCLASALSVASATTPGELTTLFQVYGAEDPEFRFS